MVSKVMALVLVLGILSGCASVNFSANYYTPPQGYEQEVASFFGELTGVLPLKNSYTMRIVGDKEVKTRGIPAITGQEVVLPDNFIKYVYQNYYEDRFKVIACICAHELCHREYPHPYRTPGEHFVTDEHAIGLLSEYSRLTPADFYKSYRVMLNYWSARKGVGGHVCNIGWNVLNAASLVYAGVGSFGDWFATDLSPRMKMIVKRYHVTDRRCYKRSGYHPELPQHDPAVAIFR